MANNIDNAIEGKKIEKRNEGIGKATKQMKNLKVSTNKEKATNIDNAIARKKIEKRNEGIGKATKQPTKQPGNMG